ncbi:hypothetical protein BC829DRAFT_443048 [Chytridium lagenaria]|nr:hypothetical protein BC829DRAFT_443048 [Chytridium lagenaria]
MNEMDERGPKKSMKEMTKAERREYQERQRAEKKARAGAPPGASGPNDRPASHPVTTPTAPGLPTAPSTPHLQVNAKHRSNQPKEKQLIAPQKSDHRPVPLLSHLTQYERENTTLAEWRSQNQVHPAIINLGLQFSDHIICGGNARCLAMLLAFKKVISDYVTPVGTSLQRHLTSHIGKQIDYLTTTRSLADSMKTAIRQLRMRLQKIPLTRRMRMYDVKESLRNWIDDFIKEKITVAASAIIQNCMKRFATAMLSLFIPSGSSVVEKLLLEAHSSGIAFRVIVCDSRPKLEGWKDSTEKSCGRWNLLHLHPFKQSFIVIKDVTKLILGASSLLSNGAVMARAGTALVAMMASDANIPVIVLCELYKFTETVRLDSFVWNEIGDPDALVNLENRPPNARLPSSLETMRVQDASASASSAGAGGRRF